MDYLSQFRAVDILFTVFVHNDRGASAAHQQRALATLEFEAALRLQRERR